MSSRAEWVVGGWARGKTREGYRVMKLMKLIKGGKITLSFTSPDFFFYVVKCLRSKKSFYVVKCLRSKKRENLLAITTHSMYHDVSNAI